MGMGIAMIGGAVVILVVSKRGTAQDEGEVNVEDGEEEQQDDEGHREKDSRARRG